MITKNISMPHPVLGISGDITEGVFSIGCKIRFDKGTRMYKFEQIAVEITNPYILSLHEKRKLDVIIKIFCGPTYSSWTFRNPIEISIPENEIDVLIEVEGFLVASAQIDDYNDSSFNVDFDDTLFKLQIGDIVGLTGSKRIPIRKENEKVSLGSIFKFSKINSDIKDQELHFDFDDDQIVVNYPSANSDFDPISLLFDKQQGLPYTALNLYIIPALTQAFEIMQEDENESYKDKKWYLTLDSLLKSSERSDDAFINAQKTIKTGLPINMAFSEILKTKNLGT